MVKLFFTLLFYFALTACSASIPDNGPSEVTAVPATTLNEAATEVSGESSLDEIIGKRLVANDGTVFLIGADRTMSGTLGGEKIVGVYERSGNEVCSTYTSPQILTGREFCSTPVIKNGTVVFNRRDGSKAQYNIEE